MPCLAATPATRHRRWTLKAPSNASAIARSRGCLTRESPRGHQCLCTGAWRALPRAPVTTIASRRRRAYTCDAMERFPDDAIRDSWAFRLGVRIRRLHDRLRGRPPIDIDTEPDWLSGVFSGGGRISPKFTLEKLQTGRLEDWLDVYEDRVQGWLLDHAWALSDYPGTNFVVFLLVVTYLESWAQYRYGVDSEGHSKEFFGRAFDEVLGLNSEDTLELREVLYRFARCGAVHDARLREGVYFNKALPRDLQTYSRVTENGKRWIVILNPRRLAWTLQQHSKWYVAALRNPANEELRKNFSSTWSRFHSGDGIATVRASSAPRRPPTTSA